MNFVRATVLLACASPILAQYGGPAILARGQAPAAMATSQIDFRPFFSVTGTYSSGLSGVSVDSSGNQVYESSYGAAVSGGVSGLHSWRRTTVGLDYKGALTHYPHATYYDSTTQSLTLGITHQLSRHSHLSFDNSAGIASNYNIGATLLSTIPFDPGTLYRPANQFYDNRTMYFSSRVDYSFQRSTRTSFSLGGNGFVARHRSEALYGVTGVGAHGDAQYRLSKYSTIGASYGYTHYVFTGIFSSTDVHTVALSYARTLSRSMEFSGYGGFAHYETKFAQTVPVDPAIAALIGINNVQRIAYSKQFLPHVSARLSYAVKKGVIFVNGGHTVTPGNGLFLTSTTTTTAAGYSYTGVRRWSIQGAGGYSTAESVGNVLGNYKNFSINGSVSRKLIRHTHGVFSVSANHASSHDFANYNRWYSTAHLGLTFAPGDYPVRFW